MEKKSIILKIAVFIWKQKVNFGQCMGVTLHLKNRSSDATVFQDLHLLFLKNRKKKFHTTNLDR